MSEIINTIKSLKSLRISPIKSTLNDVYSAEAELGVKFASDYKEYLLNFSHISYYGHELTGLTKNPLNCFNVVRCTNMNRELNPQVPESMYVIEDAAIDGIVLWQNSDGKIYITYPYRNPKLYANSLSEYIRMG